VQSTLKNNTHWHDGNDESSMDADMDTNTKELTGNSHALEVNADVEEDSPQWSQKWNLAGDH